MIHFVDNTGREWFASSRPAYIWLISWLARLGRM